jgi:hypothetical protein
MKRVLFILIAVGFAMTAAAQTRTQYYMKKIPALPGDSCNATRAFAENYVNQVVSIKDELSGEIDQIKERVDSHMESNASAAQDHIMNQMSQMYGVSGADMEKMKNADKMSEADKQAMIDKMVQQKTNMSMDEIKNLSKMSDAGKKAYTEAYATEAMANAQANPTQTTKSNEYAKGMYQTTIAQQSANAEISQINARIGALYGPIGNDPERQKMLDRIDAWNSKLTSMMGIVTDIQARTMDSIALKIKVEKIAYCNKYTPMYRESLRKHLQILKASLPDYQKYGEVTAEATKAQTGVDMPAEGKELASLEAIAEYLGALEGVFKYKLYYSEDD